MDTYSDAAYLSFVLDVVCREGIDERGDMSRLDNDDTCPCCQRSLVIGEDGRCVYCGRIIWRED